MPDAQQAPELKTLPAVRVIALEHRGAHDDIGAVYHELIAWAKQRGVRVAGQGRTVFLDPPSKIIPESARYLVCLPVTGAVKGDARVQVKDLPQETVYSYTHKGPYTQIGAKYTELLAWVSAQQIEINGSPFEIYHKHPDAQGQGNAAEFVTEICLPVDA